ncbi:hypothetical protein [Bdellovibrio sp. HCB337]|uniref:hypothetical protein n=1 Tax=Bdellovibrio sp. HCB337 TaxID=3394358 RepID=UPI0039A66EB9
MKSFEKSILVLGSVALLFLSACSSSKQTVGLKPPAKPPIQNDQNPPTPEESTDPITVEEGLVNTAWSGEGKTSEGYLVTYVFRFAQYDIDIESTCRIDPISAKVSSSLRVYYTNNGTIAELASGLNSSIPAGNGSCDIYFPAGLKFELDGDKVFIIHNGDRKATNMKRIP